MKPSWDRQAEERQAHLTPRGDDMMIRLVPGWIGAHTTEQAVDAWANGTTVVKWLEDPGGDSTPLGTKGRVLGSVAIPPDHPAVPMLPGPPPHVLYFIEWSHRPKVAVACAAWKLALVI